MAAETKRIDGKACVGTSLLCEYFGVTRQAVNVWEKKGCPKAARGFWCVADVLAWKDAADKNVAAQKVEDLPLTQQKIYWETRCREEQAENQKFKNAVIRGDYLEKAQMEKELAVFFSTLKQSVLSLPRKAAITAAQYVGNDRARNMELDMMEVMHNALAHWSRGDLDLSVDPQRPADAETSEKNKRKPVGRSKANTGQKKQQ